MFNVGGWCNRKKPIQRPNYDKSYISKQLVVMESDKYVWERDQKRPVVEKFIFCTFFMMTINSNYKNDHFTQR